MKGLRQEVVSEQEQLADPEIFLLRADNVIGVTQTGSSAHYKII